MGVMNEDRLTLYDGLIKTHIIDTTVAKEDGKGLSTNDYTTPEKNIVSKLGESDDNNLTFNGKKISAAQMTGATAETDGTSGTVTAPKAGQENTILNGDGTWKSPLDNKIIAAKVEELNKAIDDAIALRASLEAYGMVKVTDSTAVTDSTGLALPATEKNATIEGTLANQISQLNTDLESVVDISDIFCCINGYFTDICALRFGKYVHVCGAFVPETAGFRIKLNNTLLRPYRPDGKQFRNSGYACAVGSNYIFHAVLSYDMKYEQWYPQSEGNNDAYGLNVTYNFKIDYIVE